MRGGREGRPCTWQWWCQAGAAAGRPAAGAAGSSHIHIADICLAGCWLAGMGARWLGPACGHASLVTTSAASGFPRSPRSKVHVGGGLKALHLA
jgi:hypothetical protein